MEVKELSSNLFECEELTRELVVDALEAFVKVLKKVRGKVDAIYPGDPFVLPLAMFVSDLLSVPVKQELFLKPEEKILVLFSILDKERITENYVRRKILLVRERSPLSPSVIVGSDKKFGEILLIKFRKNAGIFSYRFLREAVKNYFYPTKGEITHYTSELWELSKQEYKHFLRAKRIRDNAMKYSGEKLPALKSIDEDGEIVVWEKFVKFSLSVPEVSQSERVSIKVEKLIQLEDKNLHSAVVSFIEFLAQSLEQHFPVNVAYSNLEVVEKEGVLIIPRAVQVLGGADLRLEIVLRSQDLEEDYEVLISELESSFRSMFKEVFGKDAFKPFADVVVEKEAGKVHVYLSWFVDEGMVKKLLEKVSKKWLVARLLHRKQLKAKFNELFRFMEDFEFTPENVETLFSYFKSLWNRNSVIFKVHAREIVETLKSKGLFPVVGWYGAKLESSPVSEREFIRLLLNTAGFENAHHFLAETDTYFTPVSVKRIYRPNWEKVIKENQEIVLKAEPLNPQTPITYVLNSTDGKFLGTIPPVISHYVWAKELSGKKIKCEKLYFDPDIFSETSYWVKIRCL